VSSNPEVVIADPPTTARYRPVSEGSRLRHPGLSV